MDPLNPLTEGETLDLLPKPDTIRFSRIDARSAILSKSREDSKATTTVDLLGAKIAVSLFSSLLSQMATSMSPLYVDAAMPILASAAQEWREFECNKMKMLTECLFRNTLKTTNPFLPRREVIIQPEVREVMNRDEQLRRIIDASIVELSNALEGEDSYSLDVFEESDVDVPGWNENVIRVRIGTVNFENNIKLWESLEEKVRSKIEEIRKQLPSGRRRMIDAINENLSIRLEAQGLWE
jgi:hypothetical protein